VHSQRRAAIGVLAMHHLPAVPTLTGQAAATMVMPPTTHHAAGHRDRPVIEAGNAQGCAGMDMMGHLCLAVLDSAYTSPTPLPALATPWACPLLLPGLTSAVDALSARAPPPTSSARRSQLGVWRR
jgi:hypothetical protein